MGIVDLILLNVPAVEQAAESGAPHLEDMAKATAIPNHDLAELLLSWVGKLLDLVGLSHDRTVEEIVYVAIVLFLSIFLGMVIEKCAVFVVRKLARLRNSGMLNEMLKQDLFHRCAHFIPPLVFLGLVPFAFTGDRAVLTWILRIGGIYLLITFGIAIGAIFDFAWYRFNKHDNDKNLPLKGILNVCKGILWIIITIIGVSVLVDKSPMSLLAGLGVFATALMLVFKDSILGFVAGIQLSNNDMLRVGDWIVVPSTIANGIVQDVTLTVVKVRNWDNTIVMLPPYTLVSTSFQNWRGMQDSGYRLFSRDIYIDQASIRPATDALIDAVVAKYPLMADYVKERRAAKEKGEGNVYNPSTEPNGTIDTNIGLFRAYICMYLLHHPQVGVGQDLLVRIQQSAEYGQVLNIYFYSKITSWTPYAALGSEIFEHIAVAAETFGIVLYNTPDRNVFTVKGEAGEPSPVTESPSPAAGPTAPFTTPATPGSAATPASPGSTGTVNPTRPAGHVTGFSPSATFTTQVIPSRPVG